LIALNAGLIGLYFFGPRRVFCGGFLLTLLLNNYTVNPIATGLGPLLKASATPAIQRIRAGEPALRSRRVHYAVFSRRLDSREEDNMRLLASFPENKIWIYKLPDFSKTTAERDG
jgi:hypothetical protein